MKEPLVSIIVCTYNGAAFLEEQLHSIFTQTYPNLEIIISDDGSTDNTKDIINKYKNNIGTIINYNKKNLGFSKNFEFASGLSKGNYIAYSDQDDIWLPQKIEKLYAAIGAHSLVYSDSKLVDEKGNDLYKNSSDLRKLQDIYTSKGFSFFNPVSGHSMMAKRELLAYAFPTPAGYYYDWWFALQATNLNGVKYLNEALTHYRQHDKNLTINIVVKKLGARTMNKRYQGFLRDLKWLEILANNKFDKENSFHKKLHNLFLLKKTQYYVWPLFWFLLKNRKNIFMFSKKKYTSQLFEIRKFARGEREH